MQDFLSFLSFVFYIAIAVGVLLVMIIIHELGHYLAGKLFKFRINEFAIGFGPKIFSKTNKNGEVFSLRAVPLGGFCAFHDENGLADDKDKFDEKGNKIEKKQYKSFVEEKPYQRIIVFLAGATFNFISAIIFSFIFILCIGVAVRVDKVYTDGAGVAYNPLVKGDLITAVDGKKITVMDQYDDLIAPYAAGEQITLTVVRDGKTINVVVSKQEIPAPDDPTQTYVGLGYSRNTKAFESGNIVDALVLCVPFTLKMSWLLLGGILALFTFQVPAAQSGGTITSIGMIAELTMFSPYYLLILLPLIAANLAVFNLLPIPALDGSHVVFTTIEWIRGKPINREVENMIHAIGLLALLGFVIFLDIAHLLFS